MPGWRRDSRAHNQIMIARHVEPLAHTLSYKAANWYPSNTGWGRQNPVGEKPTTTKRERDALPWSGQVSRHAVSASHCLVCHCGHVSRLPHPSMAATGRRVEERETGARERGRGGGETTSWELTVQHVQHVQHSERAVKRHG